MLGRAVPLGRAPDFSPQGGDTSEFRRASRQEHAHTFLREVHRIGNPSEKLRTASPCRGEGSILRTNTSAKPPRDGYMFLRIPSPFLVASPRRPSPIPNTVES